MRRTAVYAALAAFVLAACQDSSVAPRGESADQAPPAPGINFAISDGSQPGGNPFFFFIPPLAPSPSGEPAVPKDLTVNPTVEICQLQATKTGSGPNTVWTPVMPLGCVVDGNGNPVLVAAFGPPYEATSSIGIDANDHYHVGWTPPKKKNQNPFFRIAALLGSTYEAFPPAPLARVFTEFGFRDIEVGGDDDSSGPFAGFNGNVPVKFRIFDGAVCFAQGTLECGFGTIEAGGGGGTILADQGNALFAFAATATTGENVNIFILEKEFPCIPVDFPQYPAETELGEFCYELHSIPANAVLNDAIEFGICPEVTDANGLLLFDVDQYVLIRGHRLADGLTATGDVQVLTPGSDPSPGADCDPFFVSVGSKTFWNYAGGFLKSLVAPLRPEPLYASSPSMFFFESRTMSRFQCCSTLGYGLPASLNGVDQGGAEIAGTPPDYPIVDLGVVAQGSAVDVEVRVKDAGTLLRDPSPVQLAVVRIGPDAGGAFVVNAGAGTPVDATVVGNPAPDLSGMSLDFLTGGTLFPGIVAGAWIPGAAGIRFLTAAGYGYGPVLADDSDPFTDPPVFLSGDQVGVKFKVLVCDAANTPDLTDGAVTLADGYTFIAGFDANVSGGSAIPTTIWAVSDCVNLYVAVVVDRDGTEKVNTLRIDYDDDRGTADAGRTLGDDFFELSVGNVEQGTTVIPTKVDGFLTSDCFKGGGKPACGSPDATSQDGDARFTIDTSGTLGAPANAWVFETTKPLMGTPGEDMSAELVAGLKIGIQILLRMGQGAHGGTLWPATLGDYLDVTVISVTP